MPTTPSRDRGKKTAAAEWPHHGWGRTCPGAGHRFADGNGSAKKRGAQALFHGQGAQKKLAAWGGGAGSFQRDRRRAGAQWRSRGLAKRFVNRLMGGQSRVRSHRNEKGTSRSLGRIWNGKGEAARPGVVAKISFLFFLWAVHRGLARQGGRCRRHSDSHRALQWRFDLVTASPPRKALGGGQKAGAGKRPRHGRRPAEGNRWRQGTQRRSLAIRFEKSE